jgi:Domain of unknown function (DUF4331)
MPSTKKKLIYTAVLAGAAIVSTVTTVAIASDHDEADTTAYADVPADIGDTYAFHQGDRLTLIMTFDGYKLRQDEPNYDADVLYSFHIDTNDDNEPDHVIMARLGQNAAGEWGMKVEGIPGVAEPIIGAVDEVLSDTDSGAQAYIGLRDDPFFFDLEGFNDTLMTGTVSFQSNRDFAAFKNVHVLVIEFDHAELGATNFGVWSTTGRVP